MGRGGVAAAREGPPGLGCSCPGGAGRGRWPPRGKGTGLPLFVLGGRGGRCGMLAVGGPAGGGTGAVGWCRPPLPGRGGRGGGVGCASPVGI